MVSKEQTWINTGEHLLSTRIHENGREVLSFRVRNYFQSGMDWDFFFRNLSYVRLINTGIGKEAFIWRLRVKFEQVIIGLRNLLQLEVLLSFNSLFFIYTKRCHLRQVFFL